MTSAPMRPTTTQRVREFLVENGMTLRPWSPLDDVYEELHGLLARRRRDTLFWTALERLLDDLVADAASATRRRLPAAGAELLRSWQIEALRRDLEAALLGGADGGLSSGPALRRLTSRLTAPALGAFLFLGLAAAKCDDGDDDGAGDASTDGDADGDADADADADTDSDADTDTDSDADGDTGGDCAPSFEECGLEEGSALWIALDGAASISEQDKLCLCSCFAALNESWTGGLSGLFETATAEETAAVLEEMIACCDAGIAEGSEFPEEFGPGSCSAVYKGVSFPPRLTRLEISPRASSSSKGCAPTERSRRPR